MAEFPIQCVIVLYETTPAESRTIRSLIDCCREKGDLAKRLSILIYDNSRTAQRVEPGDFRCASIEYYHDAQNGGLAAAYNYALRAAQRSEIDWLLLLDQDTALESNFFTTLFRAISASPPADVHALVPRLMRNGKVLSPQIVGRFRNKSIDAGFYGECSAQVTALNSAACLRVKAVAGAGGFPREYWLDYLDHIMFHRLQASGGRVLVLDATIEHRLSLLNLENEMSVERYSNMLAAEWRFIRETGSGGGPLVHRARLLKRTLNLLLKNSNHAYALKALGSIFS